MWQCDQLTYGTLPPPLLSPLLGQSLNVDCCRCLSLLRTLCLVFQCVESDRHGCFHQALMSGGEKTGDVFKPFGTPQPQVSAGLPMLESVLFKSREEKDLMDPPSLWNAVFVIDRWTDSVNPEEQTPARMLRGRSGFFFLKLVVFGFYAEKLWDLLICPGHPSLHRLWDEDVLFRLWTLCQFFSLRDRQSDCFPSRLLRQLAAPPTHLPISTSPLFHHPPIII